MRLWGAFNFVYINTWRVCQTRVHNSLICIGNLPDTLSLSLTGIGSVPNKQDEWTTVSLSLAERWTITEIRRQSNSVLTYSLLTDVLPLYIVLTIYLPTVYKKTRDSIQMVMVRVKEKESKYQIFPFTSEMFLNTLTKSQQTTQAYQYLCLATQWYVLL